MRRYSSKAGHDCCQNLRVCTATAVFLFAFACSIAADSTAPSFPSCPAFSLNEYYLSSCAANGGFAYYSADSNGCRLYPSCLRNITLESGDVEATLVVLPERPLAQADLLAYTAQRIASSKDAFIKLESFTTDPNPIVAGVKVSASGSFRSLFMLTEIECRGPSPCDCRILQRSANVQAFECDIYPPVNGAYSFVVFDELGFTNSGSDFAELYPGKTSSVFIQSQLPAWLVTCVAVVSLIVVLFFAFKFFDWVFSGYRKVTSLKKKKAELEEAFKHVKYRFMKREIDELAFQRAWADLDREYSDVKNKLDALSKQHSSRGEEKDD